MSQKFVFPQITALFLSPASGPVGTTFSCSVAVNAHPPARLSYEWRLDGVAVPGASGANYTAGAAGSLSVAVSATNNQGTATQESAPALVTKPGLPPQITRASISPSSGLIGDVFEAVVEASGDPEPDLAYQWMQDGKAISGATSKGHAATVEGNLSVVATARNSLGTASRESSVAAVTAAPAAPSLFEEPTIAGTPEVGQTLTSTDGIWTGNPTPSLARNWQRDDVDIAGETASSYIVRSEDGGAYIRLRVTATNGEGSATAHSAALSIPAFTAPVITSVSIFPTSGVVGTEFTATATAAGTPAPTLSYQWTMDGAAIAGATGSTHTAAAAGALGVAITATNPEGSDSRIVDSVAVEPALAAPAISDARISPSSGFVGDVFTASATATGNPEPTLSYQWTLDGTPIAGEVGASYTAATPGSHSVLVTATSSQGTATRESAAVLVGASSVGSVFEPGVFEVGVYV